MYVTLSQLKKVIREELGRISDVKDPAEVGAVEDAWAGGDDLVDPFEFVPADRKSDEEKPPKRKPLKEQNDNSIKVKKLADVLAYLAAAQDDLDELESDGCGQCAGEVVGARCRHEGQHGGW